MTETLNNLYTNTFRTYWEDPAVTDYKGATLTYGETAIAISKIHYLFKLAGIEQGDKIALFGRNSAHWCVVYLATLSYGTVIVPILPDFSAENAQHILNHSDSVLLFTSEALFGKIDTKNIPTCKGVISIELDEVFYDNRKGDLHEFTSKARDFIIERSAIQLPVLDPALPAVISYTSGTSGFSKGVVLPLRSIYSNVRYGLDYVKIHPKDKVVSFLPLAHAYGCLFDFLMPLSLGSHVTLLTKMPTPNVVMEAFQSIKPQIVLSVPMVIEKIYERKIAPILAKPMMRFAISIPVVRTMVLKKICTELKNAFGGKFYQVVIGGAPLNKNVEEFFIKMKFPFTIGYGMTECGPLISYAQFDVHRKGGTGQIVDRMECKIVSKDPHHIPGEILVKGDNLMLGYYKDEEATKETFTADGWLKTGDLGIIDKEGFIYIRGRNKSMILGANGQNIYPEEIETVIHEEPLVLECVVRDHHGKLEALIYPNMEYVETKKMTQEELFGKVVELKEKINKKLPAYAQLSMITVQEQEFEKTPKRSIKRYLYNLEATKK